jgi:hypothetical protein
MLVAVVVVVVVVVVKTEREYVLARGAEVETFTNLKRF